MTATLSPAEQQEVTRFGIHDPEAFQVIDEHKDEVPMCIRGDAPATVRLTSRCCHIVTLECPVHHQIERDAFERRAARRGAACKNCDRQYSAPETWGDFVEEHPL